MIGDIHYDYLKIHIISACIDCCDLPFLLKMLAHQENEQLAGQYMIMMGKSYRVTI